MIMVPEAMKQLTDAGLDAVIEHYAGLVKQAYQTHQGLGALLTALRIEQFERKNKYLKDID